ELLDAVVFAVQHEHVARPVDRHPGRGVKAPVGRAARAPLPDDAAACGQLHHAVVAAVGHVDGLAAAGGADGHAGRVVEGPRLAAGGAVAATGAPLRHQRPFGAVHEHAVVAGVGDVRLTRL